MNKVDIVTQLIYLVSTGLFILSLKWMSHPCTARCSVVSGVVAMVRPWGSRCWLPASYRITGSRGDRFGLPRGRAACPGCR